MASGETTLYFKLLGGFHFRSAETDAWQSPESCSGGNVGRKLSSFLAYLVLNHAQPFASAELIRVFWPEDRSRDPANTLKNTVHKVRRFLEKMFPHVEQPLVTVSGGYAWNSRLTLVLDCEQFDALCRESGSTELVQAADLAQQAMALYSRDLLEENESDWLIPVRAYYHAKYVDLCQSIIQTLAEKNEWMDVLRIGSRAYELDADTELFTRLRLQALVMLGQPDLALEQYDAYKAQLWRDHALSPSAEVERICTLARETRAGDLTGDDVLRMAEEDHPDGQAFLCSFSVFKNFVWLEARRIARAGDDACLATIRIVHTGETDTPAADARRLERVLLRGLRMGDPLARLNASTFIVLLTGASTENARSVMFRVVRQFQRTYPHSAARLDYQVSPLSPSTRA